MRLNEAPGVHNQFKISYGMNLHNSVNYTNADPHTVAQTSVPEPSRTLLIAELSTGHDHPIIFDHPDYAYALARDPHPAVTNQLGYRHSGKADILFMDSHAAPASPRMSGVVVNFQRK